MQHAARGKNATPGQIAFTSIDFRDLLRAFLSRTMACRFVIEVVPSPLSLNAFKRLARAVFAPLLVALWLKVRVERGGLSAILTNYSGHGDHLRSRDSIGIWQFSFRAPPSMRRVDSKPRTNHHAYIRATSAVAPTDARNDMRPPTAF